MQVWYWRNVLTKWKTPLMDLRRWQLFIKGIRILHFKVLSLLNFKKKDSWKLPCLHYISHVTLWSRRRYKVEDQLAEYCKKCIKFKTDCMQCYRGSQGSLVYECAWRREGLCMQVGRRWETGWKTGGWFCTARLRQLARTVLFPSVSKLFSAWEGRALLHFLNKGSWPSFLWFL